MTDPVPHPFALIFAGLAEERFPAIRAELPPRADLDPFLMSAAAVEFLRELRPDEGLGDGVDEFVALVHAAYRFWEDGSHTATLDEKATRALANDDAPLRETPPRAAYIQVAPRLIWSRLDDDEDTFEPLDGWFVVPAEHGLRAVACFGVHPQRPGLSLLVVEGDPPGAVARDDGTPLFAPTMPGGDIAGLHAIVAPEELLLLAWRAVSPPEE